MSNFIMVLILDLPFFCDYKTKHPYLPLKVNGDVIINISIPIPDLESEFQKIYSAICQQIYNQL